MKKVLQTTKNQQGITVNKCCASCWWKKPYDGSCRLCSWANIGMKVLPDFICPNWKMRDDMSAVGLDADGQIKKKEWFKYYLDCYQEYIKTHPKAKDDEIAGLIFRTAKEWEMDNAQSRFMEL